MPKKTKKKIVKKTPVGKIIDKAVKKESERIIDETFDKEYQKVKNPKKDKKSNAGRKLFDGKDEKIVITKLEESFSLDSTVAEACFYADISEKVYYQWVKANPELGERFKALKNKLVLAARQSVAKSMKKDGNLALKYLERKRKNEFSTKTITTSEVVTGEMSAAQKKRVEEILRENGELEEGEKLKD